MKIITLFEHSEPEEYSQREILKKNERNLEEINKKLKVDVFKSDFRKIKATSYVGVLNLGNLIIEILPKIYKFEEETQEQKRKEATRNLLYMLSYTKKLKIKETEISKLKREKSSFYETLIYLFAKNLLINLMKNYPRDYVIRDEEVKFLKGKMLIEKEMRKLVKDKISCRYFEYTEDSPMNRVLKYTSYLLSLKTNNRDNWVLLQKILSIYANVSLGVNLNDFERIRFNRLNEDFKPLFDLARLFLENMSLVLQGSKFETFSLIFDMNELFEEFIGQLIRERWKIISGKLRELENCDIKLKCVNKWLVEKPKEYRLVPDIAVVDREGGVYGTEKCKLIVDTKYKLLDRNKPHFGISQEDVYQMFAYAKKFGCDKVILLYPWSEKIDEEQKGFVKKYSFNGDLKEELFVATVDLMRDLKKEIENLREEIEGIILKIMRDEEKGKKVHTILNS